MKANLKVSTRLSGNSSFKLNEMTPNRFFGSPPKKKLTDALAKISVMATIKKNLNDIELKK
jgi:hypothetical protein